MSYASDAVQPPEFSSRGLLPMVTDDQVRQALYAALVVLPHTVRTLRADEVLISLTSGMTVRVTLVLQSSEKRVHIKWIIQELHETDVAEMAAIINYVTAATLYGAMVLYQTAGT
jgi:hypothetical protein